MTSFGAALLNQRQSQSSLLCFLCFCFVYLFVWNHSFCLFSFSIPGTIFEISPGIYKPFSLFRSSWVLTSCFPPVLAIFSFTYLSVAFPQGTHLLFSPCTNDFSHFLISLSRSPRVLISCFPPVLTIFLISLLCFIWVLISCFPPCINDFSLFSYLYLLFPLAPLRNTFQPFLLAIT